MEMRTRLFLRTTEFLWQEGHTAHETQEEALDETYKIIRLYKNFLEEYMAIPIIIGEKPKMKDLRAMKTLCIEAMMQDGKLYKLELVILGQNFSKASNIKLIEKVRTICMDNIMGCFNKTNWRINNDSCR